MGGLGYAGAEVRKEIHMNEYIKKWMRAAGVRAVKTVAQTAIATIGASAVLSAVDWPVVLSASEIGRAHV